LVGFASAVVVRDKGANLSEQSIVSALEGRLAKFKLPKRVIFVDDFPRNTMGKLQKNVLRDRYAGIYAAGGRLSGARVCKGGRAQQYAILESLKKVCELLDRKSGLPDDSAERPPAP
jgi:AMP-binding enzyme C-terminal domain